MNNLTKLFFTAFMQVFFVAGSTASIAAKNTTGTFITGFAISYLWTLNVKKIAASSLPERLMYASGAACGSVCGMYVSSLLLEVLV
jgi:hypothetical protein